MIIKKFEAGTENEAMELAKEELGKDAIVMNIKTIRPKGIYKLFRKPRVEVTAAVDEAVERREPAAERNGIFGEPDRQYGGYMGEEESAIETRLNNLQALLEKQVAAAGAGSQGMAKEKRRGSREGNSPGGFQGNTYGSTPAETGYVGGSYGANPRGGGLQGEGAAGDRFFGEEEPGQEEMDPETVKLTAANKCATCIQLIYEQLVANEVDEKYAHELVGEIEGSLKRDASVDQILGAFYQKIILKIGQPVLLDLGNKKTKYVFFIGPTGVGKTTTIAKLASSLKLNRKANLAMLTADTYRIAAVEQLRTYADILGIPLQVVYSAEELAEAREDLSAYDLVLVDTAGRSHKSKEQCEDMRRLINEIPEEQREIYLVLSATTKYRDLIRITEAYKEITDYRLIFTKLDETGSIGNLFNIRMLTGAPLSYTACGQNVPDDIGKADAQQIAKKLLGGGE